MKLMRKQNQEIQRIKRRYDNEKDGICFQKTQNVQRKKCVVTESWVKSCSLSCVVANKLNQL